MSEYTPTTEEVREEYLRDLQSHYNSIAEDRFDRWFEGVRREVAEKALTEAADDWHRENTGTSPRMYNWLRARAEAYRREGNQNED